MALLFMDGFGGGDTQQLKWDVASTAPGIGNTNPRVPGGYFAIFGSVNDLVYKSLPSVAKAIVGVGFYTSSSANYIVFQGDAGATTHISVFRNSATGLMEIRRGTTAGTLLAAGTTPIALNTWVYMEASATISDTIGEVHVRLNGLPTDEISYVGDTKNAGTGTTVDRVMIGGNSARIADVYILDNTGPTNNNFLGDVAVRTLSPSAAGTYTQLTNSAGNSTNNFSYVNEHPYSSTQYVGSPTTGLRDTYTLPDLAAGVTTVYGVQVTGSMAKSDATAGSARNVIQTGGSLYYGATRGLSTSYVSYYDLFENNPNTAIAWTVADVNGLEAGMEVA